MNSEEKIGEGIFITKSSKGTVPLQSKESNKTNQPRKYLYKSTAELIQILEDEFTQTTEHIQLLHNSNEEMLTYDPNDYDLIEARAENLVIINRKLQELKEIQNELKCIVLLILLYLEIYLIIYLRKSLLIKISRKKR
jgi:hypothetical protein